MSVKDGVAVNKVEIGTYLRGLLAATDVTQAAPAADFTVDALDCGVSWVGLVRGDALVLRAHRGLITAEMVSTWHLKVGEGIGGRVAVEGKLRGTSDFHEDPDFLRDSPRVPMTRLVDAEGLRAVFVAPLSLGDQSLGVLYAAERRVREWNNDDQGLLKELGDDLGTRLMQFQAEAEREALLQDSQQRAAEALLKMHRYADLAEKLASVEELTPILDAFATRLNARLELHHSDGVSLGVSNVIGVKDPRSVYDAELECTGGVPDRREAALPRHRLLWDLQLRECLSRRPARGSAREYRAERRSHAERLLRTRRARARHRLRRPDGAALAVDFKGADGRALSEKWADGPSAFLGLTVSGFPNLFLVTGPGSPSVLSNMVMSIEQHVDWAFDLISRMRESGQGAFDTSEQAEREWMAHTNDVASHTFYPRAASWYMGANTPGKPRVFLPYAGGVGAYRQRC